MPLGERVEKLMPLARAELAELVALRSSAEPGPEEAGEPERAAHWVRDRFAELGFADVRLARTPDGSDAVVGFRPGRDPDLPTVLLHAHYDVRPATDLRGWHSPPYLLTERNGRWYGRGAADGKGSIVMHLTALRALGDKVRANLKLVVDGSAVPGSPGLAAMVAGRRDLFRADAMVICERGNAAVGRPAVTVSLRGRATLVVTVETLASAAACGAVGGSAPDAMAALVAMLATLHDAAGNTTVEGLDNTQRWQGVRYPVEQLRRDARVLRQVRPLGDGAVADMVWARPALTVLRIDRPGDGGTDATVAPRAVARLDLRIPPGIGRMQAQKALGAHLLDVAPWGVRVDVHVESAIAPFQAGTEGPAYAVMGRAMHEVYGRPMAVLGHGGPIPLCSVLADAFPSAELILTGVEDPLARAHGPDESVDPSEIRSMAHAEALFLRRLGARRR